MDQDNGRTIKMCHGRKIWRRYFKRDENGNPIKDENGSVVMWKKPQPAGGMRVLTVHPTCNMTDAQLLKAYNGYEYNPEDWKEEKVRPWKGKVKILGDTSGRTKKTNHKPRKKSDSYKGSRKYKGGKVRRLHGGKIRSISTAPPRA